MKKNKNVKYAVDQIRSFLNLKTEMMDFLLNEAQYGEIDLTLQILPILIPKCMDDHKLKHPEMNNGLSI